MNRPDRTSAFIAYLLLILGWLYVMLLCRNNDYAVYHAWQSFRLTILALLTTVTWMIGAWLLMLIPIVGPISAAASFAFVVVIYLGLFIAWIGGMINAVRAERKPMPIFGSLGPS
jgi:uncharacterized membrane protein